MKGGLCILKWNYLEQFIILKLSDKKGLLGPCIKSIKCFIEKWKKTLPIIEMLIVGFTFLL
jgi:hypothetical protein